MVYTPYSNRGPPGATTKELYEFGKSVYKGEFQLSEEELAAELKKYGGDGHANLYSDESMKHIETIPTQNDMFFILIAKNLLNVIIVLLNAMIDVLTNLFEVQREKNELTKHYWNSANDQFEPELDIKETQYIDRNNYQQYVDVKSNSGFGMILLKRYWSFLYLCVVFIFFVIQICNWVGLLSMEPRWGIILVPILFWVLVKTFIQYGYT